MKTYFLYFLLLVFFNSCAQSETHNEDSPTHTNHLIHESSPYLLQHAHNPVNWYPWGEEALTKAKKENKLLIVSIGYAACHWCHVMEHESFEDEEVADFMNANFVCIKVDREERPDIDQVYMNAVQLLIGSGGWPLNCIALPDGRPIHGGTYFRKNQWLDMLSKVTNFVQQNPEKAEEQAKALTAGVQASELIETNPEKPEFLQKELNQAFSNWKTSIDFTLGGYNHAPKFPLPVGYQYLLQHHYLTGDKSALEAVTSTLDAMGNGGIYDQVGGGFARYSTDVNWFAPHFEKMLYDNSQLVSLYAAAYQKTKNPKYKVIVEETLEFIKRELTSKEGGFYSSLDADSEGEEGKFYVWTKDELEKILGDDDDIVIDYYNVKKGGNWEKGENILFQSEKSIASKYQLSEDLLEEKIKAAKKVLLKERAKRTRPGLDDKMLTAWNSLMLKGYIDAYRVFGDKAYLNQALKTAAFINTKIKTDDNRLRRNYKNGKATINGFLDDYAFTIQAFIALYQATFDEKWLKVAHELTDYSLLHFYDQERNMFYYTSDVDPALIARKMEVTDNVTPSSNSEMAKNLFVLGHYFHKPAYIEKAKLMLNNVKADALKGGTYYANWYVLMAWFISEPYEVSIVGKNAGDLRKQFDAHYLPHVFLSGGKKESSLSLLDDKLVEGQTTIYVCQDKICQKPETEVEKAILQIQK